MCPVDERFGDWHPQIVGITKITAKDVAKPVEELDIKWLIESHLRPEPSNLFSRGIRPQNNCCRIARSQVDEGEDDDADD